MEGNPVNLLTLPQQGTDSATAMAMMNNNPWMYLVMLALFANGGFGFGGNRNGNIDAQLASMQNQINDNNNNAIAREAIQGNGFAISQLAQNLNVDRNALEAAINSVNFNIANLGSQNGMGFMGVTNAINLGNLNIIQQMKDCCCATQKQILEQGYQGRIETIQQTDDIKSALRAEVGLTRTEIAAFRQAWEAKNYQDVVAQNARLQTELDLLRQNDAAAAREQRLQQQLTAMQMQIQMYMNPFGVKTTTPATTANTGQ
jgi:hypothetical protein